jgi:hypothetical protein
MVRQLTAEVIETCLVNFLTVGADTAETETWRRKFITTIHYQNSNKGEGRSNFVSFNLDRWTKGTAVFFHGSPVLRGSR